MSLGSGDTLARLLARSGVENQQAHAVIEALRSVYDPQGSSRRDKNLELIFAPRETEPRISPAAAQPSRRDPRRTSKPTASEPRREQIPSQESSSNRERGISRRASSLLRPTPAFLFPSSRR